MEKKDYAIVSLAVVCVALFLGFAIQSLRVIEIEKQELYFDVFKEIEDEIISDSQYNFQVMRDLFTPQYNDSVTVESAGYINGNWCFWVNHSSVLNSYYFDDLNSYKVAFPWDGKIFLIK